jgi:hypothetical protein
MKKSTDYAVGGTGFICAGVGMLAGMILSAFTGTGDIGLDFVFVPVGAVIASVGAYWLWRSREFYAEERNRDTRNAPGPGTDSARPREVQGPQRIETK